MRTGGVHFGVTEKNRNRRKCEVHRIPRSLANQAGGFARATLTRARLKKELTKAQRELYITRRLQCNAEELLEFVNEFAGRTLPEYGPLTA